MLLLAAALLSARFPAAATPIFAAPCAENPAPQRVSLPTEDQRTLAATYFGPSDPKKKSPAALLVHGAGGSRADLEQLAVRLQKSGFAILSIDLRGHGESATPEFSWKTQDTAAQEKSWAGMTQDIRAGVKFLLEQPGVQASGISLVGQGAGCTLVARHAKRDERVRDLVLISPQAEHCGFSLMKDLAVLGDLPILIGAGKDEEATAKRMAEALHSATGTESTVEVELAKVEADKLVADARFAACLSRWMKAKAEPDSVVAAKPQR